MAVGIELLIQIRDGLPIACRTGFSTAIGLGKPIQKSATRTVGLNRKAGQRSSLLLRCNLRFFVLR